MSDEATEAICRLKYKYFRLLDTKRFVELGELFIEDATTDYQSAPSPHNGRAEIVEFLVNSLSDPGIVHLHNGHHPEIDVHGDGTASGMWYLFDKVIVPAADFMLEGTGIYEDNYVDRRGNGSSSTPAIGVSTRNTASTRRASSSLSPPGSNPSPDRGRHRLPHRPRRGLRAPWAQRGRQDHHGGDPGRVPTACWGPSLRPRL